METLGFGQFGNLLQSGATVNRCRSLAVLGQIVPKRLEQLLDILHLHAGHS